MVRVSRSHRRWLSGWLIAALLFSQLATAAYACAQMAAGSAGAASGMVAMPGCAGNMPAGLDPELPHLCKAHCEAGQQSVGNAAAALDVPPALALGAALVGTCSAAGAAQIAAAQPASVADGPPVGAAPLYLFFLVLRN